MRAAVVIIGEVVYFSFVNYVLVFICYMIYLLPVANRKTWPFSDDGMILHSNCEDYDYALSSQFTFQEFVDACNSDSDKERLNAAFNLSDAIRKSPDFDFSMDDFFDSLDKLFESEGPVRKAVIEKVREVFSELSVKAMYQELNELTDRTVKQLVKTIDSTDENEQNTALTTITYLFENEYVAQIDVTNSIVPALFRLFFRQSKMRLRCNETQFTNMINIVA
ncbi:unnamed protein product [Bursaphelenchus okinawaensis]|uniref:Uncharacterized protein n=1 Tax=Bursaphelenchus okinawaensis TaxID=465554 RepID=A0A811JR42_9BILA|nr:unnamed protein product [Bursaphelenchus okinawaensis]CAG9079266.1 unnamed protein product [Bursaphelenchus okinawaensis]